MKRIITTNQNNIQELAIKAAAGTLKRIETASGNETIRKLRNNLQADLRHFANAEYRQANNINSNYIISEAYNLVIVAYNYLYQRIIIEGMDVQDTETRMLKNGNEKIRTVFQWACVEVRKAIYAEKSIENNSKYTYIEDLKQDGETADNALDRQYIRIGKYYDVGGTIQTDGLTGMEGIYTAGAETYNGIQGILDALQLTKRQEQILHYRMQGIGVTEIGEKLGVSKQAASKTLVQIQAKVKEIFPDMIRGFNLDKWN